MVNGKIKEFPFAIGQLEEALEEREKSDRRNNEGKIEAEADRRKQDRRKDQDSV